LLTSTPPAAPDWRELRRRRHRRRLRDPQGPTTRFLHRRRAGQQLAITFVTVGELTQWTYLHRWSPQRRAGLRAFLASVVVLPCTFQAATVWGEIQAHARLRGRPRPINDAWIAACCLARDLPLATLNIKDYVDFAEHEGLEIVR
jgi:predicted nucleic acid-binding protein